MNMGSIQKVETNQFARADPEHRLLMVDDDMDMNALPKTNYIKSIDTDELDAGDRFYDRKYQDMGVRMDKLYADIEAVENRIEEVETRILNICQQKLSGDNVYQFLLYFDKLYQWAGNQ